MASTTTGAYDRSAIALAVSETAIAKAIALLQNIF